ncbi:MAG TPA: DNA-formamidopyrimidine glycosylase family protein [Terriglobales bacterium]|nr:DNA-formamidopyrimidine glycosylase family protein [Terriglobales bacterium]
MPELPDIIVYIEALEKRILGQKLLRVRIAAPFLLRTVSPPPSGIEGQQAVAIRRVGKRIAIRFENDVWLVFHLMIAGRLHWREGKPGVKIRGLADFEFTNGTLYLTEAGARRRASLHMQSGDAALATMDPGGLEVLEATLESFAERLQSANHTLKRALTDPRLFSGIGNAYSDEILFHAQLSPLALTKKLSPEEIERLFIASRNQLLEWTHRLREASGNKFPEKVTAFREGMAVHGRYKQPCPRCATKIQRIRYADNETNYCPTCQTGGKLLADRALSRLLRADWPRSLDEFEGLIARKQAD